MTAPQLTELQAQTLMDHAVAVRRFAHAPYSNFRVGAALWCDNGTIVVGVNVENASYGLTCCAERVALFSAVTAGHASIVALAIASDGGHAPCGACRQVIAELAGEATIFLVDVTNKVSVRKCTIAELLPWSFNASALTDHADKQAAD